MKKSYVATAAALALSAFATNAKAATTIVGFDNFDKTGAFNGNGRNLYSYTESGFTFTPGASNQFNTVTLSDPSLISGSAILTGAKNGTTASLLTITGPGLFTFNSFDALNYQVAPKSNIATYSIVGLLNGVTVCNNNGSIGASYSNAQASTINSGCGTAVDTVQLSFGNATNQFSLDNFSLNTAVVPEPASWAMMVGGLAMVGAAMRRRRPASTKVTFG